ncbi:MAG: phenylalanine--tRNA ligase subunit alpha [Candidatus Paceibacterota bacterium]|jgi:phenylalanyl-tRNA synthetase alpha chain
MENNSKEKGHLHPSTIVSRDLLKIFMDLGFEVIDGPEVESEHYNFDMLNFPKDHPARDMQDTFWIKNSPHTVLRTHTSNTQVRYMEKHKPPLRVVSFGRVFRAEATDATHEAQFYQVEGLVVDETTSVAHMKGALLEVCQKIFGEKTKIRLRPSFFPFVEPGFEVDVTCFKCSGKGGMCSLCKGTSWVEVVGAGMVQPAVLKNGGVDPDKYQGYAFGFGFDRLVMLKYGIDDIRHLYSGDLRLINQF